MDRDTVPRLMDQVVLCHKAIDEAENIAREIADPKQRDQTRKALAEASGHIYAEIMMPLIREYPELDPYPRHRS